jgi:hypothetical protein
MNKRIKLTKKETRLLRTEPDEIDTLSDEEAYDLLQVVLQGIQNEIEFFLPDYEGNAKRILEPVIRAIDELSGEDAFGTEGWRRGIFGIDA